VAGERSVKDARLRAALERLYRHYTRTEHIDSDPVLFVHRYREPRDREIAGLIASSLAFGNVKQIKRSVETVLSAMGPPARFIEQNDLPAMMRAFRGFRHRYVGERELCSMLTGARRVCEDYGTLGACFQAQFRAEERTVVAALERFINCFHLPNRIETNYLLPLPSCGSACKRLHLFLRWMVRRDAVDWGGWQEIPPSSLVVPLDTHMHRIGLSLGLTRRKSGDLRTALELTGAFARLNPDDPVKYDFALTRLGILGNANGKESQPLGQLAEFQTK
jgi:uncharacterized protein (TIGR02757 family)